MGFLVRSKSSSGFCLMEEDGYQLKALMFLTGKVVFRQADRPVDMAWQG